MSPEVEVLFAGIARTHEHRVAGRRGASILGFGLAPVVRVCSGELRGPGATRTRAYSLASDRSPEAGATGLTATWYYGPGAAAAPNSRQCSTAYLISSAWPSRFSLRLMFWRCDSTVRTLRFSSCAICLLERPLARQARISLSRSDITGRGVCERNSRPDTAELRKVPPAATAAIASTMSLAGASFST